jgi:hypothetical protein
MKYFVILLVLIGLGLLITIPNSYALIMGHPMEFWDSADIILDGTVLSTTKIDSENLVQHDIQVNQYFKNPASQQMITVYGPDIYNEKWFYPKFFNQGDRALFYLKKIDDKYMILEHSILVTEKCDPRDMIGLSTLPGEPIGRGGPILFFDPYQTCNGYLTPAGMIRDSLPPLKQIKAGIAHGDVACNNEMQLMFRDNGLPLCIKKSNVQSLLNRGWIWVQNQEYLQFKTALPTIWLDAPAKIDDSTPLDFLIEVTDVIENHNRPTITITNEHQEIVWSGQHDVPSNEGWGAFAGSSYSVQYMMKDIPEKVILKPGNYTLSVSLENQKVLKKLQVVSSRINLGPTDSDVTEQTIILNDGIDDYDSGTSFHPIYEKVILGKNNTITWFNAKQEPVRIQSDEQLFDEIILPQKSFSFTFDSVGIHRYHDPINWKRGTVFVSTKEIESSNLSPAKLLEKTQAEIAKTIMRAAITNDEIMEMRLDNTMLSAYVTQRGGDVIIPKSLCKLCTNSDYRPIEYRFGMTKPLFYPKSADDGVVFAKEFMSKIGYVMDGTEWIDSTDYGSYVKTAIQQRVHGWIIPNHIADFVFFKDNTSITLGRWYDDVTSYQFKLSQDDAKKIAKNYMQEEVEKNPSLQKFQYEFQEISDAQVMIIDDKVVYVVPVSFKSSLQQKFENGHCGGPEYFTGMAIIEGKTGSILGWDHSICM